MITLRHLMYKFWVKAPDWLRWLVGVPYWTLHPCKKNIVALPSHEGWVVLQKERRYQVPDLELVGNLASPFHHIYEKHFRVEPGDIVLDVGACIGRFTFSVADRAEKIVAIEPEPENVALLRRQVANFDNVEVVEKAVFDHKGRQKLKISEAPGSHSLFPCTGTSYTGMEKEVEVDTIDNIVGDLEIAKVDFLKMDVEGAEVKALDGGERTLGNAKKVVIAAYHEVNGERTLTHVERFLGELGFNVLTEEGIVYALNNHLLE